MTSTARQCRPSGAPVTRSSGQMLHLDRTASPLRCPSRKDLVPGRSGRGPCCARTWAGARLPFGRPLRERPVPAPRDDHRPGLVIVPAKPTLAFAWRSAAGAMSQPITCAPRSRAPTRRAPEPTNGSRTTSPGSTLPSWAGRAPARQASGWDTDPAVPASPPPGAGNAGRLTTCVGGRHRGATE
jgi:hypothetical protein